MIHTIDIFAPPEIRNDPKKEHRRNMCNQGPARPYRNTPTAPHIGALTFAFAVKRLQVLVATPKSSGLSNIQLSINTNISTPVNNSRKRATKQAKSARFLILSGLAEYPQSKQNSPRRTWIYFAIIGKVYRD